MASTLVSLGFLGALLGGGDGANDCALEAERAARTMVRIEAQWPLRPATDPLNRHVRQLAEHIARLAPEAAPPRLTLVRNLEPLAFSAGAGEIVLSDGLLLFVRDRAQLAAVLAHELAHQLLGHFCTSSREAERIRIGGVTQHFDLTREIEADREAVHLLAAAGFDPSAMAGILACLIESGAPDETLAIRLRALGDPLQAPASDAEADADSIQFSRLRTQLAEELRELGPPGPCRMPR